MGWPDGQHAPLRRWIFDNQAATRNQDRTRLTQLASEFDQLIRAQLAARRALTAPPEDTTTQLLREQVDGRPLTDEELVSIIRNWTAGELGAIAASVGILAVHPARNAELQQELRQGGATLADHRLETGEQVTIVWLAANRDDAVFGRGTFDPEGHAEANLRYGAGVDVCPGAPLARRELEIVVEEFLALTDDIALAGEPIRAH